MCYRIVLPAALLGAALMQPAPAHAEVIGDAAHCDSGKPSILLRVHGFKDRTGEVRVSLYDGNPDNWLVGGRKIHKLHLPVPKRGPVDICIKVPRAGTYAFGVTHDVEGDGNIGRKDGGAFSRNARFTLLDRKPSHRKARFEVGEGTTRMGVRLMYLKGLSIKPWN